MTRIVIIGGGIGGLATAACLRLRGIESVIYERASELREVGAALGLWPNATRVLKRLGVLEALLKTSHRPSTGALRDRNGRIMTRLSELELDAPSVFTHRADLHNVLLSLIPPETLRLCRPCTGVERQHQRVRARFADGSSSEWADGLIGADGIRSAIRETTLRDGPPIYRGYVAWRGVAGLDGREEIVGETWGRGQRFGFIPLGSGRLGWWATANKSQAESEQICARTPAEWKKEVIERFTGWHNPIPKLLSDTPESTFLLTPIMDRPAARRLKPWGEGPVTLLGDAAHPTTPNLGQGACMAIEDAAVIAHALAAIPNVSAAFRVYEMTRFARTGMIVHESLKMGSLGQWSNPVACGVRSALMRFAPQKRMRRQFIGLWGYDAWETPLIMTNS